MSQSHATTKKLCTLGLLCAISIVLVCFVHFPLFPAASFLEYNPADIPIFLGTFLFGPIAGLLLTIVTSIIQGLTVSASSGFIGIIMHILATGSFVVVFGLITRKNKNIKRSIIALIAGIITMTAVMMLCNLIFTPIFMGTPVDAVLQMMLPIILPFNLIKAIINGVVAFLLSKSLHMALKNYFDFA